MKKNILNNSNQKSSEINFWDELPDSVKESVLISLQELKMGKGKPHHVVMKKYKKWLKKT